MQDEPVDKMGNISISLKNIMNFFAVYDFLEKTEDENSALRAENRVLKDTIETLKEVIKALTHQHEDKGVKNDLEQT